ncbi:MAG: hypothetical protein JNL41_09230 [Phenylobacterium sp.]|uniref:hypothetical protein n=1 Tax=Phenylobacterium sp. TaxID=1871053 RepID=UPI001A4F1BEE|nr:hypothetical protein [Phenylobacterium sp.]MBL8554447.1 hypothetical protein [Phenylobacterium sp.]
MSSVSQTAPARKGVGFGARLTLSTVAVASVVALAIGPAGGAVASLAGQARLHAPNFALLGDLSPAIRIHLATALAALVLGGVLMAVRKGRTFHRVAGWLWVGLVAVTAGATLFITSLNHGAWSWLHLFTAWTLIILPLGVMAAKRRAVAAHRARMMGLFYGGFAINLLIAFLPGRTLWTTFFG